ncbi:gamma-glutamyl-gamma-aminobutyrate hydrolase [Collibacillus ludicampi]|uniref:Gamma-glutamyl-gamma-aminobutyrate hydrolase n=1 Tax=Collibacillus ludicampi TaxID=2771369 RepID=A0AAV4LEU3_9BACL|nr:gamma-glutamyl-gamma-aminobutyrate hydrolase family protein [Collibacillus ludicampi]GIM46283.1 gamma-glutamyl-gamma-aminobutyrate hydrolase [Collibacillus ludicampi]
MRKRVGLTGLLHHLNPDVKGVFVGEGYTSALAKAGVLPLVIPYLYEEDEIHALAENLDGLVLTGGEDVDPTRFGEEPLPGLGEVSPERDDLEYRLVRAFMERDKPILGICRGMQVLNAALGGTLWQDLSRQKKRVLQHRQNAPRWHLSHHVFVYEGTRLASILGSSEIKVNSFHHQAVKDVAPGFIVSAVSADGVIEAFESREHRFILGVQWHPENLWRKHPLFYSLFSAFVDAVQQSC